MSNTVDKVIQIEKQEVGYFEKQSNAMLDNKTANAGYGNYTKYWRDLAPGLQGQPWCYAFQDWCFEQAYGKEEAKKLLLSETGYTYYCPTGVARFKAKGQFYTTPAVGDLVFFKNSRGIAGHIEFVYAVDPLRRIIYTVGGNTSNKGSNANVVVANGGGTCFKSYSYDYSRIIGYGRPKYDTVATDNTVTIPSTPVNTPIPALKTDSIHSVDWVGTVTASTLSVRKGAGTNYPELNSYPEIPRGTVVGICSDTQDATGFPWYLIRVCGAKGDAYGWVTSKYIGRAPQYLYSPSFEGKYTVTASTLNLRATADNGTVLAIMPRDAYVASKGIYININGINWFYAQYGENVGFCSSYYLKRG